MIKSPQGMGKKRDVSHVPTRYRKGEINVMSPQHKEMREKHHRVPTRYGKGERCMSCPQNTWETREKIMSPQGMGT